MKDAQPSNQLRLDLETLDELGMCAYSGRMTLKATSRRRRADGR
jgi:hypothetical protein